MAKPIDDPTSAPTAKGKSPIKPPPPKKKRRVLLIFIVVFLLLILGGASFAAGVYFKFIDGPALAQQLKLYDYPVVGQFFPRPVTNFETVDLSENATDTPIEAPPAAVLPPTPAVVGPAQADIDKEKLEKIAKLEEAKRVTKLARLYNGMKPDEAVPILKELDDATVISILNKMDEDQVSKILAQFEPKRAARLTQNILKGKTS
jgi:flagellar protein FlbB